MAHALRRVVFLLTLTASAASGQSAFVSVLDADTMLIE